VSKVRRGVRIWLGRGVRERERLRASE
jgi:hypothetical protein